MGACDRRRATLAGRGRPRRGRSASGNGRRRKPGQSQPLCTTCKGARSTCESGHTCRFHPRMVGRRDLGVRRGAARGWLHGQRRAAHWPLFPSASCPHHLCFRSRPWPKPPSGLFANDRHAALQGGERRRWDRVGASVDDGGGERRRAHQFSTTTRPAGVGGGISECGGV